MELVIYGAQGIALGAYEAINNIYPQRTISCFLVSQRGANAEILSGVPVLELEPYANALSCDEKKEVEILIATPENVMPEIEKALDEHGLFCHVRLTSQRWAELMGYHLVVVAERHVESIRRHILEAERKMAEESGDELILLFFGGGVGA